MCKKRIGGLMLLGFMWGIFLLNKYECVNQCFMLWEKCIIFVCIFVSFLSNEDFF